MIVWFATNISKNSNGGVKRSVDSLNRELINREYKTKLIFNRYEKESYINFSFRILLKYLSSLFTDTPECIIARSTDSFFVLMIIKILKLKTKVILYSHGWEEFVFELEKKLPNDIITSPTTWKSFLIRFPMLKLCMKLSTFVISGTKTETDKLKNRYPKIAKKFIYLPNGIDIIKKDKPNIKSINIISVANSSWKKNLKYTIKLFKKIKAQNVNANLTCVGTGLTDYEFKKITSGDLSIKNMISVNMNDMSDLLNTSSILISSSRYEGGHSFAILEAMASKCVVFATTIDSTKEIITNKKNGYLITGFDLEMDSKIILNAFKQNNEKLLNTAYNSIKKYQWEEIGNQLESLLCKE